MALLARLLKTMKPNGNAELGTQKGTLPHTYCSSCQTLMSSATLVMAAAACNNQHPVSNKPAPALLTRPLVLNARCALYSAILRIRPRPKGKCAKLIPNQLRYIRLSLDLSFEDNTCNLGAVETIHAGGDGGSFEFRFYWRLQDPPHWT